MIRRLLAAALRRFGFVLYAQGGVITPRTPESGEVLVCLSPGRQITDPDEAEALGMTASARRLRAPRRG